MRLSTSAWLSTLALLPLGLAAGSAQADSLSLNCTQYQNTTVPVSCGTTATVLTTPGTYSYSDTALQPGSSTGGLITASNYPSGYAGASFYDSFVIQITNSQGSSISSTIDLTVPGQSSPSFQITGFEERLYKLADTGGVAPFVGPVPTALDFWTTAVTIGSTNATVAALPSTHLDPGVYVLEIRGNVSGSLGGGYSGTLHLDTPSVPLPAAGWLLISGLGGLVGFARRKVIA